MTKQEVLNLLDEYDKLIVRCLKALKKQSLFEISNGSEIMDVEAAFNLCIELVQVSGKVRSGEDMSKVRIVKKYVKKEEEVVPTC